MIKSNKLSLIVAVMLMLALAVTFLLMGLGAKMERVKTTPEYAQKVFGTGVMSLEIIAEESTWQEMLDNATAETFIMADVVVNGTKFESVGIRPKGNSSLTQVASTESDRFSFRIQFDEYIKDQTCFGLQSFVVNNMVGDNSYMKEYVSYDLMTTIGVDAPYYSFADIKVNGADWGLYLAVELYNESYEQRVYGDTAGMLYNVKSMDMGGGQENGKGNMGERGERPEGMMPGGNRTEEQNPEQTGEPPAMPSGNQGGAQNSDQAGTPPAMPSGNQGGTQNPDQAGTPPTMPNENQSTKENTAGTPVAPENGTEDQADVTAGEVPTMPGGDKFGGGMPGGGMGGRGSSGGSLEYTDDETSSYSAIFGNVVGKGSESDYKRVVAALKALSQGENLEEYFDVDQILRYLAAHTIVVNLDSYSSSMAQNYYIYERDGQITILPWDYNLAWGGFQSGDASSVVNFPIDTPVSGVTMESRPLLEKLFQNSDYLTRYHDYLQILLDEYFADGKFEAKVAELNTLIEAYVEKDVTAFCTYEEYQKAVTAFVELGNLRAESVQGQLNGTVPATTEAQQENPDQLIDSSGVRLIDLGTMMGGKGGQGGEGGFGKGGEMVGDMSKMREAMELISAAGGTVTDELKEQLLALGLTEEQITMFSEGGRFLGQNKGNGGNPNPSMPGQMGGTTTVNQTAVATIAALLAGMVVAILAVATRKRRY